MKILLAILLSTTLIPIGYANADTGKHRRGTCTPGFLGCPSVAPISPSPSPAPSVVTPAAPKDIFSGLLTWQGDVVAGLVQADTYEAAPINSATGAATNIYAHECLVGMPAVGTAGQAGYVPAAPGLIAWVKGLAPLAASTVPPLPGPQSAACLADMAATPAPTSTPLDCVSPSPATLAVFADNQLMGAEGAVSSLMTLINAGGITALTTNGQPAQLDVSCGAMINHVSNEIITAGAQAVAFEALLAKYVMPIVAAHKGLSNYTPVPPHKP